MGPEQTATYLSRLPSDTFHSLNLPSLLPTNTCNWSFMVYDDNEQTIETFFNVFSRRADSNLPSFPYFIFQIFNKQSNPPEIKCCLYGVKLREVTALVCAEPNF